jgi:nitrite reductase (NADH) small subunit
VAEFKKIANTGDIPSGQGRIFDISGNQIAVWNLNGNFFAFQNVCPHRGGPVGEGELNGTTITCPWHGWQFNIQTCQGLTNPSSKLTKYDVRVQGNDVEVSV